MPLKEPKYKRNQTILSVLGCGNDENKRIRIVTMFALRTAGVEDDTERYERGERGTVNEQKLAENLARTKRTIYELAFCNPWEWFFTATLDRKKYDRSDLDKFHKDLTQWLRNQNRIRNVSIKFLLIPELHSDGKSWHMHGFLMGLPKELLTRFKVGDKMGKALAEKVKRGDEVYNWEAYQNKFGFCDLEPIRNHEAVSKYVTKYISKELANSVTELNAHQYYCSRGLNRAEVIKKGTMGATIVPDFVGEYCTVTTLPYTPEKLQELADSFESICGYYKGDFGKCQESNYASEEHRR